MQDLVITAGTWIVLGGFAGGLLSLAGLWQPVVGWTTLAVLLALSWRIAHALPARPLPVWVALAMAGVAVGLTVWAGATHAEQVLPRRDSGSYLQSAVDLAAHHTRPIRVDRDSVGGPEVLGIEGVTLASPAFYAVGGPEDPAVQPQFMVGPSVWWSVAVWGGGIGAAFWAPAVAMGLALLAIGLLAARTVGSRWGPLAAALVAVCFPVLHTARSTYSEPLALIVLASGLVALVAASHSEDPADPEEARWGGVVAGLLVGGGVVLRPDALRESMLVVVVAGLALAQRRPMARPLLAGTLVTATAGLALGWMTSDQYLRSISRSLVPLLAMTVVVTVLALAVARAARRGLRLPLIIRALLPRAFAALVLLTGLVLVSRPLWLTAYQSPTSAGGTYVAALQGEQGLPVDPGRTYAEDSVTWLLWWVGPAALVIALVALAALAHRVATAWVADRPLQSWSGALLVATGSTLLILIRPAITPDHPWAERRLLVPLTLTLLLVVVATAYATRWATRRSPVPVALAVTALLTMVVALPTWWATAPHATERVERGELAAVEDVCDATRPGDVALAVDDRAANEWPQVMRGMCGIPALSTTSGLRRDGAALSAAVEEVSAGVSAHGGRVLLLAAEGPEALDTVGAEDVTAVVDTTVEEDPRLLVERPEGLVDLPVRMWFGRAP